MCCYSYPPLVESGVYRSVKFVEYLPEYGWSPVVLTTAVYGSEGVRQGGEKILRTPELATVYHWLLHEDFRRTGKVERSKTVLNASGSGFGVKSALVKFVTRRLMVPDVRIGWVIFALLPGWRSLRRGEARVIYTTSPPESAHLLGVALKALTGKPLVIDLRDPWTFDPWKIALRESRLRLALERRLERLCFARADAIVVNTPEATERYRALYPEFASKMRTITNGFDGEGFERAALATQGERGTNGAPFLISHTGLFFRYREGDQTPRALLRALRALRDEGEISPENCRVVFAGRLHPKAVRDVSEMGLDDLIELPGAVPHEEALRLMLRSDLLLLHDPEGDGATYVRGKLYEYIGSGRPVLGIVPDGANRAFLRRYGRALLAYPNDTEGIKAAIARALRGEGVPPVEPGFDAGEYDRRRLAGRLAGLLDEVAQGPEDG